MIRISQSENCCGCHACAEICPKQCIIMRMDEEGFLYPHVDEVRCIRCGACEKVCPIIQNQPEPKRPLPVAYAAINREENIRSASSSGGVFTLLAESTIDRGGVVFGAAMCPDQYGVHHIAVETKEQLKSLRESKYLQSIIGDTYQQARQALQEGRAVLFSGTPCQIEGLRCFLGREYDTLLCVDVICHGVPSPLVWKTYLSELEVKLGQKVDGVSFRKKEPGWKQYSMQLRSQGREIYQIQSWENPYMKAFLQNICLRPSCYNCRFKKLHRVSDITLGDYWGIQRQYPKMDDDKGTSLVILHTPKGKAIFRQVQDQLKVQKAEVLAALQQNPSMRESSPMNLNRQEFFRNLGKVPFEILVKKYARPRYSNIRKLGNLLRRIYRSMRTCEKI